MVPNGRLRNAAEPPFQYTSFPYATGPIYTNLGGYGNPPTHDVLIILEIMESIILAAPYRGPNTLILVDSLTILHQFPLNFESTGLYFRPLVTIHARDKVEGAPPNDPPP
jgi:hypothetical protein